MAQALISSIEISSGVGADSYGSGVMERQYSMVCDIVDSEHKEIPKKWRDNSGMRLSDKIPTLENSARHTVLIGH